MKRTPSCPSGSRMKKAEHISAYFDPFDAARLFAGVGPADVHNRDPRDLPLVKTGATVFGDGILARSESGERRLLPARAVAIRRHWRRLEHQAHFRRASFLVSRLLANMGVEAATPILARFGTPVDPAKSEKALARRPLPRPARRNGRPVPVLSLVSDSVLVPTLRVGTLGSNR